MQPDLTGVVGETVGQIQQRARELGLTWQMVKATVVGPTEATSIATNVGINTRVFLDGDPVTIGATSVIGPLTAGTWVWVTIVPPGGNYITGHVTAEGVGSRLVDFVSSVTASAAIGAEAVVLTSGTIRWVAGAAYEVITFHPATTSSVGSANVFRRLRKGSLAGTDLTDVMGSQSNTIVGNGLTILDRNVLRNITSVDVISAIVNTLQASAGTVTDNATSPRVRYMEVRLIGAAVDYPNAVQI